MRISQSQMFQSAMRGIRIRLASVASAQEEAVTMRKIRTMSDQPVDASEVLRLDAQLRDMDQFRRNAGAARIRLDVEDVVLGSMRELMSRASNVAFGVSQLPAGDPIRQAAQIEIQQIQDQLVALGNTRVGEEYVFGGARTDSQPFLSDGTYLGDSTERRAEIDDGVFVTTTHTGDQTIEGALQAVANLIVNLVAGTGPAIQSAASVVSQYSQQLLSDQTVVGIRKGEVESAMTHVGRRGNTLLDRIESVRDADPAESLLKVSTAQTALERAYAVAGRVLQSSILDFLK